MPKRKLGPYELTCEVCDRLGRDVRFETMAAKNAHLLKHWIDAAPVKIIAVA